MFMNLAATTQDATIIGFRTSFESFTQPEDVYVGAKLSGYIDSTGNLYSGPACLCTYAGVSFPDAIV